MGTLRILRNKDTQEAGLLGAFSNRWRDWAFHHDPEHGGEIVASKAHSEFEKWLDANPQHALELWTWHTYGTARKSRATWWAFSDNAFYAYWPLTEDETKAIEEWSADADLAMSFGFYVFGYDEKDGVIEKYRAFEASILPRSDVANKWTSIKLFAPPPVAVESAVGEELAGETSKENAMPMKKSKYDALVLIHGKAFADELVKTDGEMAASLDKAGFDTKDGDKQREGGGDGDGNVIGAGRGEEGASVDPLHNPPKQVDTTATPESSPADPQVVTMPADTDDEGSEGEGKPKEVESVPIDVAPASDPAPKGSPGRSAPPPTRRHPAPEDEDDDDGELVLEGELKTLLATFATEDLVVEGLTRLESVVKADISALSDIVAGLVGTNTELMATVLSLTERLAAADSTLAELNADRDQESKMAAMPASALASYLPKSLLVVAEHDKPSATASTPVIAKTSSLAKQGPEAPKDDGGSGAGWFNQLQPVAPPAFAK